MIVLRSIFVALISCHLAVPWAFAEEDQRDAQRLTRGALLNQASVYIYGDQSLDNLIAIRILGAVAKAGIHYVPPGTDLVTLISLAGGTTERAEIDEVVLKRKAANKTEIIHIDLERLMEDPAGVAPVLQTNDTILVPVDRSWISDNTLRTVGLVTSVASIFLSIVVGLNNLK